MPDPKQPPTPSPERGGQPADAIRSRNRGERKGCPRSRHPSNVRAGSSGLHWPWVTC